MEDDPLIGHHKQAKPTPKEKTLLGLVFFFAVVACALAIALGVYVSDNGTKNNTPADSASEVVETFPLRPAEPWDIETDYTHGRKLSFNTTEGTWLNVDVSPDGEQLIFDLLGDIYLLPIAGGKAVPLRTGVSFDTQPRFSPDGKSFVFRSDSVAGLDNVHFASLDDPYNDSLITNETFRFVSNAQWSPNGDKVVAVKWFTSTRSIPAGEIWEYSVGETADKGKKLVGRPSQSTQVGPEEPIYSPDGVYVYYSQNVKDSSTYEYSKDSHAGIYNIKRINLSTKRIETVAGGSGGATRPALSKSGKLLAFVRAGRKSAQDANELVIQELETGNERILFNKLSPDNQPSSASHGTYPSFSFTPDDSAIIFWTSGKLWKIEVDSGVIAEIPFEVEVNLDLAETVYPVHDVREIDATSEGVFSVKAISAASTCGDAVVFNALSRTYLKKNADDTPKAIFPERAAYEADATFSEDCKLVAHAVWSDTDFGFIEVVNLEANTTEVVTSVKGRYASPKFSANGQYLAFSRLGSDGLSGPLYGRGSGVYVVDLSKENYTAVLASSGNGLEVTLVGNDGDVYVNYFEDGGLEVAEYDAKDGTYSASLIFDSGYATDVAISSNDKWVAFVEFYEVYIAPRPKNPKSDDDAPVLTALTASGVSRTAGAVRVSRNGGFALSFSSDSKSLQYLVGPYLHVLDVSNVDTCGSNLTCFLEAEVVIDLSVEETTAAKKEELGQQIVAIQNISVLYSMDASDNNYTDAVILVRGEEIIAVGTRDTVEIPADAVVYDAEGAVVVPGFIDVHAHWDGASQYQIQQSWEFLLNLGFGVTTLHNPSADTVEVFSDSELVRSGRKVGPRLFSTGTILYGAGGAVHVEVASDQDAIDAIQRIKAYGGYSVKSYNQPSRAVRQRILKAARDLNVSVVPEGGMSFWWNLNQIIDGHTSIEHSLPVGPIYHDVITLFAESGTSYHPTLIVNYGGIWGENYWYQNSKVVDDVRLQTLNPKRSLEQRALRVVGAYDEDYLHFRTANGVRDVQRAGGNVAVGAHGQRQGLGYHWELWMLAQGGLSTYEVLKAASFNGAKGLNLAGIGSIQTGYLADLVFYPSTSSPIDEIRNSDKLSHVMKGGIVYDAYTLNQVFPEAKARAPLPPLNLEVVGA